MAVKKPLVLGADGRPQQLQSGDTISGTDTSVITATFSTTAIIGAPQYVSGAGAVTNAQANGSPQTFMVGLAVAATSSATPGDVQFSGKMTLTTGQWDAVAGTTGGLTAGTTYYLSPTTAGRLTATCPTTVGQYVVIVGKAISATELQIKVSEPVLL